MRPLLHVETPERGTFPGSQIYDADSLAFVPDHELVQSLLVHRGRLLD